VFRRLQEVRVIHPIHYRRAVPGDAAACIDLRGRTRENAFSAADLAGLGITEDSWAAGIRDDVLPGHIALEGEHMVGYCFGDRDGGEIVVLALLPSHERQSIGRRLLDLSIASHSTWVGHGSDGVSGACASRAHSAAGHGSAIRL